MVASRGRCGFRFRLDGDFEVASFVFWFRKQRLIIVFEKPFWTMPVVYNYWRIRWVLLTYVYACITFWAFEKYEKTSQNPNVKNVIGILQFCNFWFSLCLRSLLRKSKNASNSVDTIFYRNVTHVGSTFPTRKSVHRKNLKIGVRHILRFAQNLKKLSTSLLVNSRDFCSQIDRIKCSSLISNDFMSCKNVLFVFLKWETKINDIYNVAIIRTWSHLETRVCFVLHLVRIP